MVDPYLQDQSISLSRTRIKSAYSLGVLLKARFVGNGKRRPGIEEAGDVRLSIGFRAVMKMVQQALLLLAFQAQ